MIDVLKNKAILYGGGALLLLLMSKKSCDSGVPGIELKLKPVDLLPNDSVKTQQYRILANKREGMTYVPVTGAPGEQISFSTGIDKKSVFTRNVVDSGGRLEAELKV